MFKCKICEKFFETKQKLGGHVSSHFRGSGYKLKRKTKKIKNNNHICCFCGCSFKKGIMLGGHIVNCEKNPKYKLYENTRHYFKRKVYYYNGIVFDSTWEIKYAKYLEDNNIKWLRNTKSFEYTFEGKKRKYYPDFYLPETDTFVEIKGYETNLDKVKWECFKEKLLILKGPELRALGIDTKLSSLTY